MSKLTDEEPQAKGNIAVRYSYPFGIGDVDVDKTYISDWTPCKYYGEKCKIRFILGKGHFCIEIGSEKSEGEDVSEEEEKLIEETKKETKKERIVIKVGRK
jgi:hypothetical protein